MSAKYPFFGKRGRPSKVEQEICKKINDLVDKGEIGSSEIDELLKTEGIPQTQEELQTLYSFLTGENAVGSDDLGANKNDSSDSLDYTDETVNHDNQEFSEINNEQDFNDGIDDIPQKGGSNSDAVDFDPFDDPVIDRAYTKGTIGSSEHEEQEFTEEQAEQQGDEHGKVEFDGEEFDKPQGETESVASEVGGDNFGEGTHSGAEGDDSVPFDEIGAEDDIPEPEWNNTVEVEHEEEDELEQGEKETLGGDNLQELSPAQKRKAAEKTAEAVLQMYCKFAPLPFKKWASFSPNKIQKLSLNGEIDLNMQLENNVTVQDYIDGVNEQVEEVFEVNEETKEEIKDPLIDVLLEQDLALTPTQRLMIAVSSHVIQMGFSALQLSQNNKQALDAFKKYHENLRQENHHSPPPQSSEHQTAAPDYGQGFTDSDKDAVNNIINEINKEDDEVVDPLHDPSVTVEEVEHED